MRAISAAHGRIGDVQVGLVLVEAVQVVLARLAVVGPHAALIAGKRLREVVVIGRLVRPHVPVAVGRLADPPGPPGTTGAGPTCG